MRSYGPRFLLNAAQASALPGERLGENLERDIAPQTCIFSAIDFPHPPGAERRDDLVRSKFRTRIQRHAWAQLYMCHGALASE